MKACVNNNVKGRWFFKEVVNKTTFGMTMPGRSYNAHTSRHGFTGHEKESDLAEGIYTTEYRLYDARVGRWLSVDPLFEKYVGMSPYNYCMLNPVMMVDPDGRETEYIEENLDEDDKKFPLTTRTDEFAEYDARYNCHWFAWETEEDDPTRLGYEEFCKKYGFNPKGERVNPGESETVNLDHPTKEILDFYNLLDADAAKQVGDRVLYFIDADGDGKYNPDNDAKFYNGDIGDAEHKQGDRAIHSAIVSQVKGGCVNKVMSKPGSGAVRSNHPANEYDDYNFDFSKYSDTPVTRIYYRHKSK